MQRNAERGTYTKRLCTHKQFISVVNFAVDALSLVYSCYAVVLGLLLLLLLFLLLHPFLYSNDLWAIAITENKYKIILFWFVDCFLSVPIRVPCMYVLVLVLVCVFFLVDSVFC